MKKLCDWKGESKGGKRGVDENFMSNWVSKESGWVGVSKI